MSGTTITKPNCWVCRIRGRRVTEKVDPLARIPYILHVQVVYFRNGRVLRAAYQTQTITQSFRKESSIVSVAVGLVVSSSFERPIMINRRLESASFMRREPGIGLRSSKVVLHWLL